MTTGPQTNAGRGRPKKRTPVDDPRHPVGTPQPPANLEGEALHEWERVVPLLEAIGKIIELDRATLVIYCDAWSEFQVARADLTTAGALFFTTPQGSLAPHPSVATKRAASKTMADCSMKLGLSPRDRERLATPAPADERNPEDSVHAYNRKIQEHRKKMRGHKRSD